MDFDLTEDQQEIKRTARELLAARAAVERVREAAEAGAYDDALWQELSELGWPGIAVAEEHGGQGLGAVELARAARGARATRARRRRSCRRRVAASLIQARRQRRASARAGCRAWPPASRPRGSAPRRRPGRRRRPTRAVLVLIDDDGRRAAARPRRRRRRAGRVDRPDAAAPRASAAATGAGARSRRRRRPLYRARSRAEVVGVCAARARHDASTTSRTASSSARRSAPSRPSRTAARRCCCDTERARSTAYFAAWAADADPERLPEAAALAAAAAADGRARGHRGGDPGARRHRLHLGGRRALAVQARAARRGAARRRGRQRARLARIAGARAAVPA